MATTYTDNGGGAPNGSDKIFTFTFPVLQNEDVKVALNNSVQATTKYAVDTASNPTKITFNNTSIDSSVQETSGAPKSGVTVRVFRETTVGKANGDDDPKAVFAAGSSIRATDLNANTEQALYAIAELRDQPKFTNKITTNAVTTTQIASGTIVNDNVNASAAIDGTKISPDFGSQNITTTGTVNGVTTTELSILDGATVTTNELNILDGVTANKDELNLLDGVTATTTELNTLDGVTASTSEINILDGATISTTQLNNLQNIEPAAKDDQTASEIKTLYEDSGNNNASYIKTTYESNSDTNAFTDAEKTKLGNLGSLNALSDVNTSGVADGKILKYQASSSSFIIADDGGSGSGGATAFTGLSDTPANFGSAAGKTVKVNAAGNALEFVTVTTPAGNFVGLTDTPANFTGAANKTVKVNSAGNALEFVTVATPNTDLDQDSSPQLAANLDVQTNEINTSTTNGNIKVTPNGTGLFEIKGNTNAGTLQLNCENNSHGVKIKGPAHSAAASYTLTLPNNIVNGQFLKTDASGNLSWDAVDLTNLSATNLTSGTIPDARFPATLPAVSGVKPN